MPSEAGNSADLLRDISIVSAEQRPDLIPVFDELSATIWPFFVGEDDATIECWDDLFRTGLSRYQFLAIKGDGSQKEDVVATSNSVPVLWKTPNDDMALPEDGWNSVLYGAVELLNSGQTPNALSGLSVIVLPELRGSDLAERMIGNMKTCARTAGFETLVVPVRPTKKSSYPLASFEEYMSWVTPDGAPFDPWVRKHWHLGAKLAKIAPRSMRVLASLSDWTEWTGLRFPVSGSYHIEGGLAPLIVDVAADTGLYEEPNIWVRHSIK